MRTRKAFDCVAMKRSAQRRIRALVRGMSPDEEIAFFRAGAEEFQAAIEQAKSSRRGRKRREAKARKAKGKAGR